MEEKRYAVAIDGPSGAGKSTLAKAAAGALGIAYVDTGAMYRAIGCAAMRGGLETADRAGIVRLLPALRLGVPRGGDGRVTLNGEDVTRAIRLPEVSLYASAVASIPEVRDYLLERQRALAREQSVIMDGRDIGTVVLPDAAVKIYLTASAEVRARRRCRELEERGTPRPYEEVLAETAERDRRDMTRAIAPLRPAADAVTLDTSALDFEESLRLLLETIKERLRG